MIFCAWVSDERAAEHGEVLGEHEHGAAVDRAPAGDHAVAGDLGLLHAEVDGAVLDEHVELLERALVEQQLDALARGELAALVLRLDARLAAAQRGPWRGAAPACRGCPSWAASLPEISTARAIPWRRACWPPAALALQAEPAWSTGLTIGASAGNRP